MNTERLSAKEAIEALKAHQLKWVNAGILEEVSNIQRELKTLRVEFDEVHKENRKVSSDLNETQEIVRKHGEVHLRLETELKGHTKHFQCLHQSHTAFNGKVSKLDKTLDTTKLQNERAINELREEVAQITHRIQELEESEQQAIDNLRRGIANSARRMIVEELEEKLEDFMRKVGARFGDSKGDIAVPDSFADMHTYQYAERRHVGDASPLTGPVHFTTSPRQDSDQDRWKPIDIQTAVQATPPPLPETLPFVARREVSCAETPSTFREARPTRQDISNIIHARPAQSQTLPQVQQQKNLLVTSVCIPESHLGTHTSTLEQGKTDWKALTELLGLRQEEDEILTQYLGRFRNVTAKLDPDHETVSACLRRFVNGMIDERRKIFVRDWLTTSDWTVENIQDCIHLLTKYGGGDSATRAESDLPVARTNKRVETEHLNIEICSDHHDLEYPVSNYNTYAQYLSNNQANKTKPVPRNTEIQQRIQPARAAKVKKLRGARVAKDSQRKTTEEANHEPNTRSQQHTDRPKTSNEEIPRQDGAESIPKTLQVEQDIRKQKPKHKSICQRELKSLLGTRAVEKSVQEPLKSLKRKTVHQAEDSMPQNSQAGQIEPQKSPPRKVHLRNRPVPKLVARSVAKLVHVPETSDALQLPPMPTGLDGQEEAWHDSDLENGVRKRGRKTSSLIPILSLNPSDFLE